MLKKSVIAACCLIAICLAVTLWIVPAIQAANSGEPSSQPPVSSAVTPKYIVGSYEGQIAVFQYGEIKPFQILESKLTDLPAADQTLLERGIEVASDTDLIRVLEDYSE